MEKIRIAVIGAGAVTSTVHLPIVTRRTDLFHISALFDLNEKAVASLGERFAISSAKQFSSADAMFAAGNLDAVLLLNSGSHADLVVHALSEGLDVFCEKPLVYTHREIAEIKAALLHSGKKLMVGYMKTHDHAVRQAAKLIASEGKPRTVDVLVLHPSGESQLATSEVSLNQPAPSQELRTKFATMDTAIVEEALGAFAPHIGSFYTNVLCGSFIHELSVLRALGLEITKVDFVDRWPANTSTESIIVLARTADDVRITLRWLYIENYPEYQEEVMWVGEHSSHHIQFGSPYFLRYPTKLTSITNTAGGLQKAEYTSYKGAFETELEEFADMVKTSTQRGNDISSAESDLRVLQLIAKKIAEIEGLDFGGDLARQ